MGDKRLLVGVLDDAGAVLYDIKQLLSGTVSWTQIRTRRANVPDARISCTTDHPSQAIRGCSLSIAQPGTKPINSRRSASSRYRPFPRRAPDSRHRIGTQNAQLDQRIVHECGLVGERQAIRCRETGWDARAVCSGRDEKGNHTISR